MQQKQLSSHTKPGDTVEVGVVVRAGNNAIEMSLFYDFYQYSLRNNNFKGMREIILPYDLSIDDPTVPLVTMINGALIQDIGTCYPLFSQTELHL